MTAFSTDRSARQETLSLPGVFFVAAALALSGRGVTAGTAIVFVQLLNDVLGSIQTFPGFFAGAKASFGLIDKLAQALDQNVPDEGEPVAPRLTEGISVRDLSFAYEEGKPALRSVGMQLRAGGCYALVGGSGSGKSTILKLDGYTRVIVTHDLDENILRRCSALFILKNGAVAEQGTFGERIEEKGYFYSLYTVSREDTAGKKSGRRSPII